MGSSKTRIDKGTTYVMEVQVLNPNGTPGTGLTLSFDIRNAGTDASLSSGTLTEIGTTGVYTDTFTFSTVDQFRILYTASGFPIVIESLDVVDVQVAIGDLGDTVEDNTSPGGILL